ncbi:tyrosine-type recombinase/integrase [Entomomonas sp. E2T0]|uniref:tyrosine-type recombinase/integrase n=1 Tax=Entomomonas sp. E2T0 TaxID=2930213 RepID=UPI0022284749|nr:site-specific integrase [Entomomonas sp. E2T0]UYZ83038.1 tyrosine-type recombinase/integrase [Entomomonas sp. E2T0]
MTFSSILTYQMLLESYLATRVIRPSTESSYRASIRKLENGLASYCADKWIKFDTDVNSLTQSQVAKWRSYELVNGLCANSWNTHVRHLKAIFNHAIDVGLLTMDRNPFYKMAITSPNKRKKTLSLHQVTQARLFLAGAQLDEEKGKEVGKLHPVWFWQTVFETFYYTGMRRNQLIHLKVGDVHLKNQLIKIRIEGSKTWREYEIPISNQLLPYLEQLLWRASLLSFKAEDQLFNVNRFSEHKNSRMSKVMTVDRVSNVFEYISKRIGIQVSPHRFRHTLGTDLMKEPERNLHLVKELLGHTNIKTTLEYVEPDLNSIKTLLDHRG